MSVLRCACNRTVDLDLNLEDWEGDTCRWCAEEQETQNAAQQQSDDDDC